MPEATPLIGKYGDAAGYDAYMGDWSKALAPLFLNFAALQQPASLIDVGCGTGNLLLAAASSFPGIRLVGIDPSAALLQRARAHTELAPAELIEGTAERTPFADATFDGCLSLLVLQEFTDRAATLSEMRRVTRTGGVVAACQWDFAQMPVIATLVEAMSSVNSAIGTHLATRSVDLIGNETDLASAWTNAIFRDVSAYRIKVTRQYRDFDHLWTSLLAGSTPSTLMLTAMPHADRDLVRQRMQTRFPARSSSGLEVTAEALAVRGLA